ncbi:T9SS type A sorting domain-containing protein [Tenacibaculum sp. MEBiC06402]|uniref:T9SS type A sorting domain-containing protein n=1 Tax=unclassified Tenacibaculum TaxID=2635139 RepID=UPI003B9A6F38
MKLKVFLLTTIISLSCFSQNITFQDANFKAALLAHGNTITGPGINVIDTDGDGEISFFEASDYRGEIRLVNQNNISNLNDLYFFTRITSLHIDNSFIVNLYLSNNIGLKKLEVSSSPFLSNIDLGTINLEHLSLRGNVLSTIVLPNTLTYFRYHDLYNAPLSNINFSNCPNLEVVDLVKFDGSVNLNSNTALKGLYVLDNNQITSLDLSNNNLLDYIIVHDTNITSLDLSNKSDLTFVDVQNNLNLSALNVNNSTSLIYLYCQNNQITELDLSTNPVVRNIRCQNNKLTKLDLANGNNQTLRNQNNYRMDATGNPDLKCINIDYGFIPPIPWWNKDLTATYSDKCINPTDPEPSDPSLPTLESFREASTSLAVYPNPSKGIIHVKSNQAIQQMNLLNMNGELISSTSNGNTMNISNLKKGMYLLEIRTENKIIKRKIIKE